MDENKDIKEALMAISSVDGRYCKITAPLREVFSEFALQKYRTWAEIQWLVFQGKVLKLFEFTKGIETALFTIYSDFNIDSAVRIKEIEKTTNHDVKAVEYYIKERPSLLRQAFNTELIHLFLTSDDITNIAIGKMISEGRQVLLEELERFLHELEILALALKDTAMIAHTHGQPATPSTMGKELIVFASRISQAIEKIKAVPIQVKFNGPSGNFNAQKFCLPRVNWRKASEKFITKFIGFESVPLTTQINTCVYISELFDALKRVASIFIDLDRDMWTYISMEYFKQKVKAGETGSSIMPHKVNPIDFENSEGNMGIAEVNFGFMSNTLAKSRLQRDLTDSTKLRFVGTIFGHFLIGIKSAMRGLGKIQINPGKINSDIVLNPQLLSEPIQMMMRLHNEEEPYEKLKEFTRGQTITMDDLHRLIESLTKVPEDEKKRLLELTVEEYIGDAPDLVDDYFSEKRGVKQV